MKFRTVLKNCMRCNRDIPEIDQCATRKYCRECSKMSLVEKKRDSARIRRGAVEKPCFVCGKPTFCKRNCSVACSRMAVRIDKMQDSIKRKLYQIEKQRNSIQKMKDNAWLNHA